MQRIDLELVSRKFFSSREKAVWAIKTGCVRLNGKTVTKSSLKADQQDEILVVGQLMPYVSKGGLKLEKGIDRFELNLKGKTVLDVGCSTGGFADCALQHGAEFVYGIDVGSNQLDEKLKNNPRLKYIENLHIKDLTDEHLDGKRMDFICVDLSFISLSRVVEYFCPFLSESGEMFMLIKPQFELDSAALDKNGFVGKEKDHLRAIERVREAARQVGFHLNAMDFAPLMTYKKNIEYITLFTLRETNIHLNLRSLIQTAFTHKKALK